MPAPKRFSAFLGASFRQASSTGPSRSCGAASRLRRRPSGPESDYADGRHPDKVEFAATIEEDLSRRDFTINAMAFDLSLKTLVDPHDGQEDLHRRLVRAVGDPPGTLSRGRAASAPGFALRRATRIRGGGNYPSRHSPIDRPLPTRLRGARTRGAAKNPALCFPWSRPQAPRGDRPTQGNQPRPRLLPRSRAAGHARIRRPRPPVCERRGFASGTRTAPRLALPRRRQARGQGRGTGQGT